ncbi:DUF2624 family protein [Pseudalkalibacillus caeni]|uniref:DUF2624 domain-containing protein n=1 Tax=Exobacillus caeni TaxID=2574798 RepID=A0A5R9FAY1_9BACL|nr:DUF2624 family protein [Pseudalkalibacillus caeni]TLS39380.1 DUF2624 domain-containing protein [Pseudalkalibacillus caeni]
MNMIQLQLVNYKLNNITPSELIQLSNQYGIKISQQEAKQIIAILRQETIDVSNVKQRKKILQKISKQVNPQLASKVNKLIETVLQ